MTTLNPCEAPRSTYRLNPWATLVMAAGLAAICYQGLVLKPMVSNGFTKLAIWTFVAGYVWQIAETVWVAATNASRIPAIPDHLAMVEGGSTDHVDLDLFDSDSRREDEEPQWYKDSVNGIDSRYGIPESMVYIMELDRCIPTYDPFNPLNYD